MLALACLCCERLPLGNVRERLILLVGIEIDRIGFPTVIEDAFSACRKLCTATGNSHLDCLILVRLCRGTEQSVRDQPMNVPLALRQSRQVSGRNVDRRNDRMVSSYFAVVDTPCNIGISHRSEVVHIADDVYNVECGLQHIIGEVL